MRRHVSFHRALSALAASLALTVVVAPTAAAVSPARLPAAFHITLPWATGAKDITCAYGCGLHNGLSTKYGTNDQFALDFVLKPGTPVLAVASGRVEWAGWCNAASPSASLKCNGSVTWPKYGNSISIQHYGAGSGFTSFYAHLSKINVKSGQVVKAGQVIGLSGATGTEGGPHLHFAMYFNAGGAFALHTPTTSPPYGGVAAIPEPFSNCTKADGSSCIDLRLGDSLVPGGVSAVLQVPAISQSGIAGPLVAIGRSVAVTATGTWCMGGTGATAECGGPDGIRWANPAESDMVLPSAKMGALMARIGSGPWFAVGSSTGFTATVSGRLTLAFTDRACCYSDNSGSIQATVIVSP